MSKINNSVSADFVFSTLVSRILSDDLGPTATRSFAERSFAKYSLVQEQYGTIDAFYRALRNSAQKFVRTVQHGTIVHVEIDI